MLANADTHNLPRRIGVLPAHALDAVPGRRDARRTSSRRPVRVRRTAARTGCARTLPPAAITGVIRWLRIRRAFCWPGWNSAARRPASGAAAITAPGSNCTAGCRPATRPAASAWRSRPRVPIRFTRWCPTGWAARCWASIAAATAASAGRKWAAPHFAAEGQSSYNNTIAVHPDDPDTVVCGLNDIHISRDGGATWRRASRWDAAAGDPQYVHSDQHAIVLARRQSDLRGQRWRRRGQ